MCNRTKIFEHNTFSSYRRDEVGYIYHEYPLMDNNYELVILRLDPKYKGHDQKRTSSLINQDCALYNAYADIDIVSPIVTISSSYEYPIYISVSNTITRVDSSNIKFNNCLNISVIRNATEIVKHINIAIPSNFNFRTKIIYIENYNLFISGCRLEDITQHVLNASVQAINDKIAVMQPAIDLKIYTTNENIQNVHFNINGVTGVTDVFISDSNYLIVNIRGRDSIKYDFESLTFENGSVTFQLDSSDQLFVTLGLTYESIASNPDAIFENTRKLSENITKLQKENKRYKDDNEKLNSKVNDLHDDLRNMNNTNQKLRDEAEIKKAKIDLERERIKSRREATAAKNDQIMNYVKIGLLIIGAIPTIVKTVQWIREK